MAAAWNDGCVWITGGSQGLGRALALRLADEGARVVVSARGEEDLNAVVRDAGSRPGKIDALPLDVTEPEAVAEAVARIESTHGPLSLAVLNAGTHKPDSAVGFAADGLAKLMNVNVMGVAHGLDAVLPRFLDRGRGHIAIVGSVAGYGGLPYASAYGASKAALINMAESLQPQLAARGIKLQIVNPGFVRTPLTDKNDFKMPFLMEPDAAAEAFVAGLRSDRFEIVFPRRLAYLMKLMSLLPYGLYFRLTRRLLRDDPPGQSAGKPL